MVQWRSPNAWNFWIQYMYQYSLSLSVNEPLKYMLSQSYQNERQTKQKANSTNRTETQPKYGNTWQVHVTLK